MHRLDMRTKIRRALCVHSWHNVVSRPSGSYMKHSEICRRCGKGRHRFVMEH